MLPTLNGRIQTRIALLVVVGGLWTLLLTPLLVAGTALTPTAAAAWTAPVGSAPSAAATTSTSPSPTSSC